MGEIADATLDGEFCEQCGEFLGSGCGYPRSCAGCSGNDTSSFRADRIASQQKRASNREQSAQMLRKAGIPFTSHNNGAHLVVADRYDFWPGTGLWRARGDKSSTRGVQRLIQRITSAK